MSLLKYFFGRQDLGIDLGTANTLIYMKGKGIVVNQPSIVTFDRYQRELIAVGFEAQEMMGKVHPDLETIRPIQNGVIADLEMTERMLKHFISDVIGQHNIPRNVVVSLPHGVTEVERRAVVAAITNRGARRVCLLSQPIAAAIGIGLNVKESQGIMIVDIGGGTTQVAVISNSGIVVGETIKVAGDELTEAIVRHLRVNRKFLVGERTAEKIKCAMGAVYPISDAPSHTTRGRDLTIGKPRAIELTHDEIRAALEPCALAIVQAINAVLEVTPAELTSDILERGIFLTGGGALLGGLGHRISEETGLEVHVNDEPLHAVAIGSGKAMMDLRGHRNLFMRGLS